MHHVQLLEDMQVTRYTSSDSQPSQTLIPSGLDHVANAEPPAQVPCDLFSAVAIYSPVPPRREATRCPRATL